ncbi:helix-turn-helix domain-containing protein [Labrenzia sp. R4_1]|uniref:helix-turn-helix domain-containing protein n=1 Tax=Labrenzia sp. R4_1 TaxID=2821106 RepID=UPI001ADCF0BB|nr:helix-turn-helix domain-containing protein [Labrenzia sp. R4_1]MBO9424674.1 helix-turn-helix domain-containing protein [Labrenzia sp. R4_1]
MSNKCSSLVWEAQFGSMTRKLIAARLADHADDDGRGIWPSVERIAAQCDTSTRTVQRTLADFVKEGLLKIVSEGGRGPSDTRRYDFDMDVLKAVPEAVWGDKARETPVKNAGESGANKGDCVSPLAAVKGDTVSDKGDTDDKKGCQGVTQTTIEPPIEPSIERERASAGANDPCPNSGHGAEPERGQAGQSAQDPSPKSRHGLDVSPDTWKRRFKKAHKDWPTFVSDSEDAAEKEWFALAESDREKAAGLMAVYVHEVKASGRKIFCTFAVYLREKRWEKLSEKALRSSGASSVLARPYGKAWGALRFADLMREPYGHFPPPTRYLQQLLAAGGEMAEAERRRRTAEYGWPKVNTLHDDARNRHKGAPVDPELAELVQAFDKVAKGSALFSAWKTLHERRGWPWLGADRDLPDWIYMPAPSDPIESYESLDDAVKAALARFENAHANLQKNEAAE